MQRELEPQDRRLNPCGTGWGALCHGPPPTQNHLTSGMLSTNTHRLRRSALAANAFVRCAFAGVFVLSFIFLLAAASHATPVSVARDPPVSAQLGLWFVPISGRPLT